MYKFEILHALVETSPGRSCSSV